MRAPKFDSPKKSSSNSNKNNMNVKGTPHILLYATYTMANSLYVSVPSAFVHIWNRFLWMMVLKHTAYGIYGEVEKRGNEGIHNTLHTNKQTWSRIFAEAHNTTWCFEVKWWLFYIYFWMRGIVKGKYGGFIDDKLQKSIHIFCGHIQMENCKKLSLIALFFVNFLDEFLRLKL